MIFSLKQNKIIQMSMYFLLDIIITPIKYALDFQLGLQNYACDKNNDYSAITPDGRKDLVKITTLTKLSAILHTIKKCLGTSLFSKT